MMNTKTYTQRGWVAITDYGNGKIVKESDDVVFYSKRPHGWLDNTRWVRATAVITVDTNSRRYNNASD